MKNNNAVKWFSLVLGIVIMSLGIAIVIRAGLGATPIGTLPLVVSYISGYSYGTIAIAFNLFLMVVEILLLRKNVVWIVLLLQFPMTLIFGWSVDHWLQHTEIFAGYPPLTALAINMLGNSVLALGITLEVASNTIMLPGEGVVVAFSMVTETRFSSVKIANDVIQTVLAIGLSLIFFAGLRGIGFGTIISAFAVGLIIRFYAYLFKKTQLLMSGRLMKSNQK